MSSAKAAPQATVTLKQMATEVAEGHDLTKKQAEAALSALMTLATRHLQNGDKVRLTGLGVLQVQDHCQLGGTILDLKDAQAGQTNFVTVLEMPGGKHHRGLMPLQPVFSSGHGLPPPRWPFV